MKGHVNEVIGQGQSHQSEHTNYCGLYWGGALRGKVTELLLLKSHFKVVSERAGVMKFLVQTAWFSNETVV